MFYTLGTPSGPRRWRFKFFFFWNFWNFGNEFLAVGGDGWGQFCRHARGKISAHVDGGLSGSVAWADTGARTPIGVSGNFLIYSSLCQVDKHDSSTTFELNSKFSSDVHYSQNRGQPAQQQLSHNTAPVLISGTQDRYTAMINLHKEKNHNTVV